MYLNLSRIGRVLVAGVIGSAFTLLAKADLDLDLDLSIRIGNEVEVAPLATGKEKGPPPWAPAHGRRAKAVYHYYPDQQVYRDASSGVWFYYRDGRWELGARLPVNIGINSSSSFVSLAMDTGKPYTHHEHVLNSYPKSHVLGAHQFQASAGSGVGKKGRHAPPGLSRKNGKSKGR